MKDEKVKTPNALEVAAAITGKALAEKVFAMRKSNVEVHLSREELSAICAAAFELGWKADR